ncbi:MAG: hypothetical protein KDC05_04420 [Bacteroidales bacterium]|nr:hypothetical protein [Bacteroidales bacterium]
MKFFGFFNDKTVSGAYPADFVNYEGFYADAEPAILEEGQHRYILLGNVYTLPGYTQPNGDNEELLRAIRKLYESKGKTGLTAIDGEFTLIISQESEVVIYRDFKGTGPQIFYNDGYFSNDLGLFLKISGAHAIPDFKALSFFMMFGFIPPEKTGIEGIKRLKGGHLLHITKGVPVAEQLQDSVKPKIELNGSSSAQDYSHLYFDLHKEAIGKRIAGKSKIGLLLSGGYDSGGNLAGIRSFYEGDLTSYTISFKDNPHSELEFTRIMADEFNSELKHYEINGSEIADLPQIVKQTGVPFQESGLMINYLVMRSAAGDNPDIVLGGDGNDQLFGTANKELAMKWFSNVSGIILAQKIIKGLAGESEQNNLLRKINFYNRKIDRVVYPDRWGFNANQLRYPTEEHKTIRIDPVFTSSYEKLYENRRKNVDLTHTAFNIILFKASQMAELFDIPLSFPYLSKPVFDFVDALPVKYKVKGSQKELLQGKGVAKFIHKATYRDKMPKKITSRKKQGGFVPLSMFFNDDARNSDFFELINSSKLLDELLVDKTEIIQTLKSNIKNQDVWFWYQQVYYSRLFNMLVLAIWEKIYLRNEVIEKI